LPIIPREKKNLATKITPHRRKKSASLGPKWKPDYA